MCVRERERERERDRERERERERERQREREREREREIYCWLTIVGKPYAMCGQGEQSLLMHADSRLISVRDDWAGKIKYW